jgi:hypothetical protein
MLDMTGSSRLGAVGAAQYVAHLRRGPLPAPRGSHPACIQHVGDGAERAGAGLLGLADNWQHVGGEAADDPATPRARRPNCPGIPRWPRAACCSSPDWVKAGVTRATVHHKLVPNLIDRDAADFALTDQGRAMVAALLNRSGTKMPLRQETANGETQVESCDHGRRRSRRNGDCGGPAFQGHWWVNRLRCPEGTG